MQVRDPLPGQDGAYHFHDSSGKRMLVFKAQCQVLKTGCRAVGPSEATIKKLNHLVYALHGGCWVSLC